MYRKCPSNSLCKRRKFSQENDFFFVPPEMIGPIFSSEDQLKHATMHVQNNRTKVAAAATTTTTMRTTRARPIHWLEKRSADATTAAARSPSFIEVVVVVGGGGGGSGMHSAAPTIYCNVLAAPTRGANLLTVH